MSARSLPAVLAPGSSPVRVGRVASRGPDYRTSFAPCPLHVPCRGSTFRGGSTLRRLHVAWRPRCVAERVPVRRGGCTQRGVQIPVWRKAAGSCPSSPDRGGSGRFRAKRPNCPCGAFAPIRDQARATWSRVEVWPHSVAADSGQIPRGGTARLPSRTDPNLIRRSLHGDPARIRAWARPANEGSLRREFGPKRSDRPPVWRESGRPARGGRAARPPSLDPGTTYRPMVRTTPAMSLVARRAPDGERRLIASRSGTTSSSGIATSSRTSRRAVSSGMRPMSWSACSSSRGSSCGTMPIARSNSRTNSPKLTSQSRRAASSSSSGCLAASCFASATAESSAATIGSPSRNFRWATTR